MATDGEKEDAQYIQRISDIHTSYKMLPPIRGYAEIPLVSLEEAVEPLDSILPKIKDYVYVARQRCTGEPADGLTQDESTSIILYSMAWEPHDQFLYFVLNATLRSEDRGKLKSWFLYLRLFHTALSRIPSQHRTVYRGIKSNLIPFYRKDETLVWWSFSSCTASIDVLQSEFLDKTDTRTIFYIECDAGKDISRHRMHQCKKEILLFPGCQFKVVVYLNAGNGLHMVHLKEEDPPNSPVLMLHPSSGRNSFDLVNELRESPSRQTSDDKNISNTIEQQTKEAISHVNKMTVNKKDKT